MRSGEIIVILLVALIILIVLYVRQRVRSKVYQPSRTPVHIKNNPLIDHYIYTNERTLRWTTGKRPRADNIIHVWHSNSYKGAPVVLYFHGNSDDISRRFFMCEVCKIMRVNLLLVEYRGYGKSAGSPTPINIIEDANTAYNFLRQHYEPEQIIVWGESLGGTPALWVAAHRRVHALILLSTFSTLDKLLPSEYGVLNEFIKLACVDIMSKTKNREYARMVTCKTFVLHSKGDKLIPYWHAKDLVTKVKGPCEFVTITGDHETPNLTVDDVRSLTKFIGVDVATDKLQDIINIIKAAMEARLIGAEKN